MIEALDGFPDNVAAYACRGHVTRKDYETVLVPGIEARLKTHDKLRIYYEIGPDFEAIEPGAMWEDMKVGMSHLTHWERIALVTDVEWIRLAMQAFGFLVPARIKVFPTGEASQAREWIVAA